MASRPVAAAANARAAGAFALAPGRRPRVARVRTAGRTDGRTGGMVMDADDAARAAAAALHARMEAVGSDGGHVGVDAGLEDGRIRLARADAAAAESRHPGEHRHVPLDQAAAVEVGRVVRLSVPAAERALRLGMAAMGDAGVAADLGGTIADP